MVQPEYVVHLTSVHVLAAETALRDQLSAGVPEHEPLRRRSGRLSTVRRTLGDVTPDTATLIRDGLALDADQRAVVANALLESLRDAGDTNDIEAAWRAEASRRLAEVRAGAVELVDADEHYARLRASLTE